MNDATQFFNTSGGGYQIERSVRLNAPDSAYLSRTPASAGNRKTWTWAGWVKRSAIADSQRFFGTLNSGGTLGGHIQFTAAGELRFVDYTSGGTYSLVSSSLYRDPSAWYHIVCAFDTTQATASNRIKLYVNNVLLTAFSTANYHPQNTDGELNNATAHGIGRAGDFANDYFTGYFADIHFIDGQALDPTSFTEVDATTGQLIPKAYTGSFGTNGFRLAFADNSNNTATTLGKDSSPNGNNWTPNNLSVTAGAGNDSLTDTPTSYGTDTGAGGEVRGNYCTLNPLENKATSTNGNLDASVGTGSSNYVYGNFVVTTGKWYWEVFNSSSTSSANILGVVPGGTYQSNATLSGAVGYYGNDGTKFVNGIQSAYGSAYGTGTTIGIALNLDANTITFYRNNVSQGAISLPTSSTGWKFNCANGTSDGPQVIVCNFGQRQWAYAAPAGYKALCDTNLPAPVVAKPSEVMDVKLYTGNGSTQTISGLGFSPDLVWQKSRTLSGSDGWHSLVDSVRGVRKNLASNANDNEYSYPAETLSSFNSDGFDVTYGAGWKLNASSQTYVAWTWDAGSSTVTNTDGSITSQVRANPSAGFSIAVFSAGTTNAITFGHGLGVKPSLIITKQREQTGDWSAYHSSLGATKGVYLNSTSAAVTSQFFWNNTEPTSSIVTGYFATGSSVAYCFAPVAGYSAFGSYTGNGSGSSSGPFIYTGFKPKWLLIKGTNAAYTWYVFDAERDPFNGVDAFLNPNNSNAESTAAGQLYDFLSNGFRLISGNGELNANGSTYIYACFAESPFQYARAR